MLVRIAKYEGFCVYRRSYSIRSHVILVTCLGPGEGVETKTMPVRPSNGGAHYYHASCGVLVGDALALDPGCSPWVPQQPGLLAACWRGGELNVTSMCKALQICT